MLLRRRSTDLWADQSGSSSLEFIVAGVVLLVPVVYLIAALGLVQEQALGVESAARHAARAVATADGAASADARAGRVVEALIAEYDLDPDAVEVSVACVDDEARCPAAGTTLRVTVTSSVRLPLVPPVLGLDDLALVGVESTAVQKVSRYWSEQ